jgi:outer membrane protein assembly factor BamC
MSLSLEDSLDRAWRRVGLSLDRIGFTVEDRDRSKGVYYVRYIDPDKESNKPGFFSRMFGAEEKKESEQYQIHLQTTESGTDVAVKTKDGAPESGKTNERILSLLYEQLK